MNCAPSVRLIVFAVFLFGVYFKVMIGNVF